MLDGGSGGERKQVEDGGRGDFGGDGRGAPWAQLACLFEDTMILGVFVVIIFATQT